MNAQDTQAQAKTGEPGIIRGRSVAVPPPGTVVFLFGIRINSWSQVRHWLPLVRSLRKMIREQESHPESGLLWSTNWRDGREFTVLQYWKDMDALMAYAQNKSFTHAGAWKKFNHGVGDSGLIGLWHEAYTIDAESPRGLHTIYRDLPARGLAAATEGVDAEKHALRRFARERG